MIKYGFPRFVHYSHTLQATLRVLRRARAAIDKDSNVLLVRSGNSVISVNADSAWNWVTFTDPYETVMTAVGATDTLPALGVDRVIPGAKRLLILATVDNVCSGALYALSDATYIKVATYSDAELRINLKLPTFGSASAVFMLNVAGGAIYSRQWGEAAGFRWDGGSAHKTLSSGAHVWVEGVTNTRTSIVLRSSNDIGYTTYDTGCIQPYDFVNVSDVEAARFLSIPSARPLTGLNIVSTAQIDYNNVYPITLSAPNTLHRVVFNSQRYTSSASAVFKRALLAPTPRGSGSIYTGTTEYRFRSRDTEVQYHARRILHHWLNTQLYGAAVSRGELYSIISSARGENPSQSYADRFGLYYTASNGQRLLTSIDVFSFGVDSRTNTVTSIGNILYGPQRVLHDPVAGWVITGSTSYTRANPIPLVSPAGVALTVAILQNTYGLKVYAQSVADLETYTITTFMACNVDYGVPVTNEVKLRIPCLGSETSVFLAINEGRDGANVLYTDADAAVRAFIESKPFLRRDVLLADISATLVEPAVSRPGVTNTTLTVNATLAYAMSTRRYEVGAVSPTYAFEVSETPVKVTATYDAEGVYVEGSVVGTELGGMEAGFVSFVSQQLNIPT